MVNRAVKINIIWRSKVMQNGFGLIGGLGIVLYLVIMLGMLVGYVIIIIAIWRGIKPTNLFLKH